MANTVFILGAGASKQAGVPLMTEFLDEAYSLWKRGKVRDADAEFKTVFDGVSLLQQVHSKSQLDIKNVESVFAAFEMAKTLGRFVEYTPTEIDSLVSAMPVVIARTIEETLSFETKRASVQSKLTICPP